MREKIRTTRCELVGGLLSGVHDRVGVGVVVFIKKHCSCFHFYFSFLLFRKLVQTAMFCCFPPIYFDYYGGNKSVLDIVYMPGAYYAIKCTIYFISVRPL